MLNVASRMRRKVATIPTSDTDESPDPDRDALRDSLKYSASLLKEAKIPFALGGSYALWVHGAPEGAHDVDLVVAESEVEAAAACLGAGGFEIERPPEDWLFKAYRNGAMVDVLHRLGGDPVDEALIDSAVEGEVLGLRIPVLPATEVMIHKLGALSEHYADFAALLPHARAVREQLDWKRLRAHNEGRPFAEAFLFLAERLGLVPEEDRLSD
jgi:hypothetical protein